MDLAEEILKAARDEPSCVKKLAKIPLEILLRERLLRKMGVISGPGDVPRDKLPDFLAKHGVKPVNSFES